MILISATLVKLAFREVPKPTTQKRVKFVPENTTVRIDSASTLNSMFQRH
jgi:hypothetical protein